jgi:hypothetical protein
MKPKWEQPKGKLSDIDQISEAYLNWFELHHDDQLGLGRNLLNEIATKYYLPVPDFQSGKLSINEEEYVKNVFVNRMPLFGTVTERFGVLKRVSETYQKHFNPESQLNFSVEDATNAAMDFLEKRNYDLNPLDDFLRILSSGKCKTLEEVSKCAYLSVPDYKVISAISGGIGNVFLIQHERQENVRYALKIVGHQDSIKDSPLRAQQFLSEHDETSLTHKEADINALIKNPHSNVAHFVEEVIVEYHDKRVPAIKMEYVPGETLKEYLARRGKLTSGAI